MPIKKIRLGDLLVEKNVITERQLEDALNEQKTNRLRLGKLLVNLGYVEERELLKLLAEQLKVEFVDLTRFKIDLKAVEKIGEMDARKYRALVIDERDTHYVVVMTDPTDIDKYDKLQALLDKPIEICVATESEIISNIDYFYTNDEEIKNLAGALEDELGDDTFDIPSLNENISDEDAPVARFLQGLFEQAIQLKASDIHIEPDVNVLRVRMRVDGHLQEQLISEKRIVSALVLRLKLMCGLDISEKRIPQDGRFRIKVREHDVDIRLSTMPIQDGESVVMRLLDQTTGLLRLEHTGIDIKRLKDIRKLLSFPHGLILVTGPTGSGKTTTLYSALSELNTPDRKIITIEDPVEYRLSRVNQIQVNQKIELTFSRILRSILRQDPDVILIGEMRDQETAKIGLKSAVTGHLVLSTLHTNDTLSSAVRLLDMGAEPYLLASGLRGIIAQRLVRRICSFCCEDHLPEKNEQQWISRFLQKDSNISWKKGRGCVQCHNTGYKGRAAIFEILIPNHAMLEAIRQKNYSLFVSEARKSSSYTPLAESAILLAQKGITSLEEVLRVSESIEEVESFEN